jgi:hypothetical protein
MAGVICCCVRWMRWAWDLTHESRYSFGRLSRLQRGSTMISPLNLLGAHCEDAVALQQEYVDIPVEQLISWSPRVGEVCVVAHNEALHD